MRTEAMAHHRAGRMQAAADAWGRAAEVDPAHAETRNNLGVALQALGRLDEAARAFAEATRLRPGYADAWENRVAALLGLERYDDAIAVAREMVGGVGRAVRPQIVLATALARC